MNKLKHFILTTAAFFVLALPALAQSPLTYRVDTVNALQQITLYGTDAKVCAWVGGYSSRDDGLGGMFFYDGTSSATTNTYMIFKPFNNNGRWFKLPTSVANQVSAVTVDEGDTYAWKLLRNGQTNFLAFGADNNIAYIQSWNSKNLHLNHQGNNVVLNGIGSGAVIVGSTLAVTNGTTAWGGLAVGTAATAGSIKQILSATAQLDYPSIAAYSITNLTIAVAGAGTNSVAVSSPANGTGFTTGAEILNSWVSSTNTVTVSVHNTTAAAIDPASIGVRTVVFQY